MGEQEQVMSDNLGDVQLQLWRIIRGDEVDQILENKHITQTELDQRLDGNLKCEMEKISRQLE